MQSTEREYLQNIICQNTQIKHLDISQEDLEVIVNQQPAVMILNNKGYTAMHWNHLIGYYLRMS